MKILFIQPAEYEPNGKTLRKFKKVWFAAVTLSEHFPFGEQMQRGAEMAVQDLNAKGGVLGQKLELSIGDDASTLDFKFHFSDTTRQNHILWRDISLACHASDRYNLPFRHHQSRYLLHHNHRYRQ